MHCPTILFISPFLWTMKQGSGVPTLYQTILGFSARTEAHVLLPASRAATVVEGGIIYHAFRLHIWARFFEFGPERSIFSHRLPGGRMGRYLLDKLLWAQFVVEALFQGCRLARWVRPGIFYGVTPYGAPVAFLLRAIFGGINVTRLLGTFLTRAAEFGSGFKANVRRALWLLPRFAETLAFRIPSAALVITDDATRGREVARALGRRGALCWRNGIDVPSGEEVARRAEHRRRLVERLGLDPARRIALYVGQLVAWKRVDRLLDAIAALNPEAREGLTALVVGDGPERERLEALARTRGVAGMVRFLGASTRDELGAYYLGSDVFVAPHDLTCACNATFEAMAAGLAVIATDCGDTRSIVTGGAEGWLVEPSTEAIAGALREALSDAAFVEAAGGRARARILADFGTWEMRVRREYNLIRELAGRPLQPAPALASHMEGKV
jgi:glycosyltransferase involved in cell wall biosynthesis